METLVIIKCLHGSHPMSVHQCKVFFSHFSGPSDPRCLPPFIPLIERRSICLCVFLDLEPLLCLPSFLVAVLLPPASLFVEVYLENPNSQFILGDCGAATRLERDTATVTTSLDVYLQSLLKIWLLIVHVV